MTRWYQSYLPTLFLVLATRCTSPEVTQVELEIPESIRSHIRSIRCQRLGGVAPEVAVNPITEDMIRIHLTFDLPQEIGQDDWRLEIEPAFQPDFHWSPHLTPTDEHVVDQHSFRSPAVMAASEDRLVALIPDLSIMARGTPVRWYMDLDAIGNTLTLGMSNSAPREHVLFVRKPGARYHEGKTEVGFYLVVSSETEAIKNPWRSVLAFLWEKWGRPRFESGEPLEGDLSPYVEHTYNWAFGNWRESIWQEFELDGRRVGAPVFIVNQTQSPNYPGQVNEREFRSIWNQAWFSSLRAAPGLFRHA